MLDLNAAVRGLVPPECIKSGVVDDDDAAGWPAGRDIGKNPNKIMAEPGPIYIGINYIWRGLLRLTVLSQAISHPF